MEDVRTRRAGRAGVLAFCLVAMLAIAATAATSASAALPEWGGCEASPTHEGKYADSSCIQPVTKVYKKYTGAYEWYAGAEFHKGHGIDGYNFEGAIGPTTFEATNGKVIQCSGGQLHQLQITGPKSVGSIWTTFEGCESEGQPCEREFATNEGEMSDQGEWADGEGFKGELVYVSGRGTLTPTIGLTLTAFNKGAPLFTVVCRGALGSVEIGGAGGRKEEKAKGNAVISLISPVDQMAIEFAQTFTQAGGMQDPEAPQIGRAKVLQMLESNNEDKWFQMGLSSTWTYVSENERRPVEIKAAL